MAQATLLVSFFLGLLIIGAVVLLTRGQYRYRPNFATENASPLDGAVRAARTPAAWTIAFILLVLLAGGGAVLAVGGFGASQEIAASAGALLAAVGGVVLVGYLFYGTFVAARARGLHSAQAAALGSWAVGLLLLVAVAASLLEFA